MEALSRPTLTDFQGVSLTKYFTDNWDNVQNFQARPEDILVATYPKAGTTWVSYILDLLYFGNACEERQATVPLHHRVPFLEISIATESGLYTGKDQADSLPTTPRLIKTHLPVQFIPRSFWEQNCRIVYVARNAKDNVVSFYHFDRMNRVQPEPGDWDTYLLNFMEGKVAFGSWHDHVNGWWGKKHTYSKMHFMLYEDMVEDTGREIDKLCSFLGLSPTAEDRERVITQASFDSMKKNNMTNYTTAEGLDHKVSPFMRKGKVGDWKNHFTVAQNEMFDQHYHQKMKNSTLQFRHELQGSSVSV